MKTAFFLKIALSASLFLLSACQEQSSQGSKKSWLPKFSSKPQVDQVTVWKDLFNGNNLEGWTQRGGKAKYFIEDGAIVGETVRKTPNSFLCTNENYSNFILEYEFKVGSMNSGVQIRSNSIPSYRNGRVHGYQVEIDPSSRAWTAGIFDEARRGWLDPKKVGDDLDLQRKAIFSQDGRRIFKKDGWNKVRVYANGDIIRTWLNGKPRADLKDNMTQTGFIGLQVHAHRHAGQQVRWKNIRIKVLN